MSDNLLATEFQFCLPRGFVDDTGVVHRQGTMRLATARDELVVQKDQRVNEHPTYGTLIMLSQVIITLGQLANVTADQLERLFTQDLAYLKEFYNRINQQGHALVPAECPKCAHGFKTELMLAGES